jgi:hypothetical protein
MITSLLEPEECGTFDPETWAELTDASELYDQLLAALQAQLQSEERSIYAVN